MSEFRIGEHTYRTRAKLDARQQFHISRRLMPLIMEVLSKRAVLEAALPMPDGQTLSAQATDLRMLEAVLQVIAPVLAKLPDDECDYVLDRCLAVVQRLQGANGTQVWSDIFNARSKQLMFADIGMPEMMQMAREVIQENLTGFFTISPNEASAPATGVTGLASIGPISPTVKAF
jgi:hypothetical protein